MNLKSIGWSEFFENNFRQYKETGLTCGRISAVFQNCFRVYTENGEIMGKITGKMIYENIFPAIGDWVALSERKDEGTGTINAILPRKSKFSRKSAGNTTEEQIIAANIDTVFIVMSLNDDFNNRRLERFLSIVWESGATPVVVLTKADICTDLEDRLENIAESTIGIDICVVSSYKKEGLDLLSKYMKNGKTVALIGSSGAGKSTLINAIIGEERMKVNTIREDDDKGRHTTTHRELIALEDGALIDNPGMREIQILSIENGVNSAFEDIEELASKCRFRDCRHESEPGCAVKEAIVNGVLTEKRYENYKKLQKEMKFIEEKNLLKASVIEKTKWKSISKYQKKIKNNS